MAVGENRDEGNRKLPYTVGGDEQSSDLFTLFDRTIALLKGAYDDQQ